MTMVVVFRVLTIITDMGTDMDTGTDMDMDMDMDMGTTLILLIRPLNQRVEPLPVHGLEENDCSS